MSVFLGCETGRIFTDWTHNYSNGHPGFLRSICSLKTALSKVVLKGTYNPIQPYMDKPQNYA